MIKNPFSHTAFDHVKATLKKRKRVIFISLGSTALVALIVVGGAALYLQLHDGRIYRNVLIGGVDVSGMTQAEASSTLQAKYNQLLNQPAAFSLNGNLAFIPLREESVGDPDLAVDLIDFDVDKAVQDAFAIGRSGNRMNDLQTISLAFFNPVQQTPHFTILEERLGSEIRKSFADFEVQGKQTAFNINTRRAIEIGITEGVEGKSIDTSSALQLLAVDLADFTLATVPVQIISTTNVVNEEEAASFIPALTSFLESAPYTFEYESDTGRSYSWTITATELAEAFSLSKSTDRGVEITFSDEELETLFAKIEEDVNVRAQNARFVIEDGKVVEFAGSHNGTALNKRETAEILFDALGSADAVLPIAVDIVEPEITTGSVNDLGIKEVLGVGYSSFAGSPANRIANIRHGASKLNGLLIPPGETVSLVEELKPFTIADGYLPELVIKGDEIIPEIGGGLCQIGTTTFRAAMHSGLEIVERRNHSLVVGYYNDPSNGNPGTDATLYDPAPDFKFKNDTGNYILLTTEVDLATKELFFRFWGTSDGRKGSYTPPKVLSWNGYGATQYTETTTLAPGVTKCQAPHSGATTTFTYMIERADGTVDERVFNSTYRSLPRICLVGKAADVVEEETLVTE